MLFGLEDEELPASQPCPGAEEIKTARLLVK